MAKIYVVGLGPGSLDDLTLGGVNRINKGKKNFLRTEKHPTIEYFKENSIDYKSFDYLYEEKEEFEEVYREIVDRLIDELSLGEDINYFVPGNPLVAERTVEILLEKEIDIEIIGGMSFIDPLIMSVKKDPINGLKIVDGTVFDLTMIDINTDTIITQVYNNRIISEIKLILSEVYGDEYNIYIIDSAGIKEEESVDYIPIYKMDRIPNIGYLTSIYIPGVEDLNKEIYDLNDLIKIMKKLRGADGCPWDIKQTHKSLRSCMIEEAYELVDSIDRGNVEDIIEELGDVLLQVIFHSEIAFDEGDFSLIDVTTGLAKKLIFRHPNIFLQEKVVKSEEVVYNWDRLKDLQRGFKTVEEKLNHISGFPSSIKSYKTQEVAAKFGFDWDNLDGPLEKIKEEYEEIIEVLDVSSVDEERLEEEIGDLFFAVINLARFVNVDPELAMNSANNKFVARFKFIERKAIEAKRELKDMTLEEMEALWTLAKEKEQ